MVISSDPQIMTGGGNNLILFQEIKLNISASEIFI